MSLVVFVSFVSLVLTECPSPGTLIEELVVSYVSETRLAPPSGPLYKCVVGQTHSAGMSLILDPRGNTFTFFTSSSSSTLVKIKPHHEVICGALRVV